MPLDQENLKSLSEFFKERQDSFVESLEKAVSFVANDEYIKQMFENKLSTQFIPDRICEVVYKVINEEREKYIVTLIDKLNFLKICFGEEAFKKIQDVGMKLNSLFSIPVFNESEYKKLLNNLSNVLLHVQDDIKNKLNNPKLVTNPLLNHEVMNFSLSPVPKEKQSALSFSSLKETNTSISQTVYMIQSLKKEFSYFKNQTIKLIHETHSTLKNRYQINEESFNRAEFLKTIENQSKQINQLSDQIKQMNTIQASQPTQPTPLSPSNQSVSSYSSTQNVDKLKARLLKAKDIIQQLSQNNDALITNQEVLTEKIKKLKQRNSQLKKANYQFEANNNTLLSDSQRLKETNSELLQLKNQNSSLQKQIENQKEKYQKMLRTLELDLQHAKEEKAQIHSLAIDEKDRRIKELNDQLEEMDSLIRTKSQQAQQLLNKLQEINNANDEKSSSLQTLTSDNSLLISSLKRTRRELRIQKQVNQEYAQQIEELKKTFSKAEEQVKSAQGIISAKLLIPVQTSLNEGLMQIFKLLDEEREKRIEYEKDNNKFKMEIKHQNIENVKNQEILKKLTEQLKSHSGLRDQLDSQETIINDSKASINKLTNENEVQKTRIKELTEALSNITSERDDLIEYKKFADTLKKQNLELQKDLKNSKAKFLKHESEFQTMTTTSQRQYSEQLKELSKQLKEANNRIQRIQTQSGKSFPIESFEDIPRIFSEIKQQLNKANTTLSRIKTVLQIKENEELVTEIKVMKQDCTSLREFLKETAEAINAPSLRRCSKIISDMKEELDNYHSRDQKICQILSLKDASRLDKKLESVLNSNKIISDILNSFHINDENEIIPKINLYIEKDDILIKNKLTTAQMLEDHFQTYNALIDEKKDILAKLKTNENLESSVHKLMEHCQELEGVTQKLQLNEDPKRVNSLISNEKKIKEICNLLQVNDISDITPTINELVIANNDLIDEEEKIMSALAVMTPDSIIPKIDDLSKILTQKTALIDKICESLRITDQSKLNPKFMKLIQIKKEYKACKKILMTDNLVDSINSAKQDLYNFQRTFNDVCKILKIDEIGQIKPTILNILKENNEIKSINSMFPQIYSGGIKDRISQILKTIKDMNNMNNRLCEKLKVTKFEEIETCVKNLLKSLDSASELFSEMLKSLLATDIEINFPISNNEKERLLKIFNDNKKRNEDIKLQLDLVLNKALSFGYKGSSITEAVDVIVAAYSEADKQMITERMHDELMSVRAATEKNKITAEKQKDKSLKKISKLKQTIITLQDNSAQKEAELMNQLQKEKQKNIELSSDLGNEQRIHRELMELLSSQMLDGKIRTSKLSKKESDLLAAAQSLSNSINGTNNF